MLQGNWASKMTIQLGDYIQVFHHRDSDMVFSDMLFVHKIEGDAVYVSHSFYAGRESMKDLEEQIKNGKCKVTKKKLKDIRRRSRNRFRGPFLHSSAGDWSGYDHDMNKSFVGTKNEVLNWLRERRQEYVEKYS